MKKVLDFEKGSPRVGLFIVILIVVIGFFSITQLFLLQSIVDSKIFAEQEAVRPANIEIYIISDKNCPDCSDMNMAVNTAKTGNVNITFEENLDVSSPRAQEFIKKYSLGRIPAVVVSGEIGKIMLENFEKVNDGLVFVQDVPPYVDINTDQVVGLVTATLIEDSSCKECISMNNLVQQLKTVGIAIVSEQKYERTSSEGQQIIQKYDIVTVPTVIFSKELGTYGSAIDKQWVQVGSKESDGSYVVRALTPPYVNTSTKEIRGLVTTTILTDKDCVDCFDAEKFNLPILQKLGLVPSEIKTVDVQSEQGKKIIATYAIEKAPTIILTGDVGVYQTLTTAWAEVGTIESDGAYVFRNVEIGKKPYRDIVSGLIVTTQEGS